MLAVLLHGLVLRAPLRLDSVRRFLLVGVPLGVALVTVSLARFGPTIAGFAAILLYALLCELYIFCFTLVLSSVSATILIMLREGPVNGTRISSALDPREMVNLRLERMIKNSFIERRVGRLLVTEKGMKLQRAFAVLRRFFGHDL